MVKKLSNLTQTYSVSLFHEDEARQLFPIFLSVKIFKVKKQLHAYLGMLEKIDGYQRISFGYYAFWIVWAN